MRKIIKGNTRTQEPTAINNSDSGDLITNKQ